MSAEFVSTCQKLAQADPFAPNFDLLKIKFAETKPLNESFNKNGNESSTFTLLMGGLMSIYFLMPVINLIQVGLLKVALKYSKFRIVRKIGKMIKPSDLESENFNYFKGSCVEIMTGFFLQINAYAQKNYKIGELKTVGEVINMIFLAYFTIGVISYTLGSAYILWNWTPDDLYDVKKHPRN